MKKRNIVTGLVLLGCSSLGFANTGGFNDPNANTAVQGSRAQGGFVGTNSFAALTTVEQAKQMPDDSYVTLRGTIEKQLKKDKYLFKDDSGTVTIEIDNDDWNGVTVTPQDKVEILGEVDKGFTKVKIDVKQIKKL